MVVKSAKIKRQGDAVGSSISLFLWFPEVRQDYSAFRSALDEATHLAFKDVPVDKLDNLTMLKVRLKVSKLIRSEWAWKCALGDWAVHFVQWGQCWTT